MKSAVYSKIDPGTVYLGSPLWERQWSNFMGNTLAIDSKLDSREWAKPSPEFTICAASGNYTHLELGYTEWSETRDSYCAGVLARHRGDVFEAEVHSLIFHDNPGMLRRFRLFNVSAEAQEIQAVKTEHLNVERQGAKVLSNHFEHASENFCGGSEEAALAVLCPSGGLFLGIIGGGHYELFAPDADACALGQVKTRTLPPGKLLSLPETFVLPFTGQPDATARKHLADFLLLRQRYGNWETEKQRDSETVG